MKYASSSSSTPSMALASDANDDVPREDLDDDEDDEEDEDEDDEEEEEEEELVRVEVLEADVATDATEVLLLPPPLPDLAAAPRLPTRSRPEPTKV